MLTEVLIFAIFYAIAFIGHASHARSSEGSHRFALYAAVVVKALSAAAHEYAVHFLVYSGYVLKSH